MAVASAVDAAMRSPEWLRHAADHDRRVCLIVEAVLDELHPLGPVQLPPSIEAGISVAMRDRRIVAEFDGRNTAALARRYHLTRRQIYRIIQASRSRR